jgi:hypothetical protein
MQLALSILQEEGATAADFAAYLGLKVVLEVSWRPGDSR